MKSISFPIAKTVLVVGTIGLALTHVGCATMSLTGKADKSANRSVQAIYTETAKTPGTRSTRKNQESEIQQLQFAAPTPGVTRVHRDSAIQTVSHWEPATSSDVIQTASAMQPADQWCPPVQGNVQQCPPEPRWPAAGPNPMAPGMMACDACNVPSPEKFTDEYLCDGGDRDWPFHYDSASRLGLDTEDTVLEFTNRAGFEKAKPSNKVCIYAPRFASVRTVSRPHEEHSSNEVAGVGQLATTGAMHSRLKASNSVKREMTGRVAVRSRAGGLETGAIQGTVSQLRSPSVHDKLLNIYQALGFVRTGKIDDADTARLDYGIQAAFAWTRDQNPVITAKTDMALEGHFQQSTAVITGIDEKEDDADNLRIIKLADKKTAQPGDEIEFTIRYDNLGGREVHHIRIVDNLTPRLQYIDDSATSDRKGNLVLQDNGEGSQILIWEMEEPLLGKTGGVVTFKARVR